MSKAIIHECCLCKCKEKTRNLWHFSIPISGSKRNGYFCKRSIPEDIKAFLFEHSIEKRQHKWSSKEI